MKKLIKKTNRYVKSVNNLGIIGHQILRSKHIIGRDWEKIISELRPIYEELDNDYSQIDLVDLIYYERWLNERN